MTSPIKADGDRPESAAQTRGFGLLRAVTEGEGKAWGAPRRGLKCTGARPRGACFSGVQKDRPVGMTTKKDLGLLGWQGQGGYSENSYAGVFQKGLKAVGRI